MVTHPVVRGLALLAMALACGGPTERYTGDADPYNGVLDNTFGVPALTGTTTVAQGALAPPFMPLVPTPSSARTTCNFNPVTGANNISCYQPQTGFSNGQAISFFNAGQIRVVSFGTVPTFPVAQICDSSGKNCVDDCAADGTSCAYPPSMTVQGFDGGGGFHADVFPHSCTAAAKYDPVIDNFPRSEQFPIANDLPLNNAAISSTAKPPLGLVAVYGVSGVSGETCNDLKYAQSITNGKLGAKRSDTPTGYEVWMIFDPVVPVLAKAGPNAPYIFDPNNAQNKAAGFGTFWFNGLQANYLASTRIPVNANGNLLAMDGVLVASSTSFSATDPTANNRVILPYQPGDPGYSPIVRLHTFQGTQSTSSPFNAICPKGATCADGSGKKFVKFSDAATDAASTILIVASPQ